MSKIQKALKALRQSQKSQEEVGSAHQNHGRSAAETVPANNPSRGTATPGDRNLQPVFAAEGDEFAPKHSIEIPAKNLVDGGLLPSAEDVDVISQQFRRIKRPILQAAFQADLPIGENANVIMIASAMPGAGKSFSAFNLSQSIALERDFGALLVDADVLKPGLSRSFGLQDHIGLIDYLVDPSIVLEDILVQTNYGGVIVIPAGRKHSEATELLASQRMKDLVSLLAREFKNRAIIFDMPPLLLTSEAQVLAEQAGQIVLVIEARVSSRESVVRALGLLDRQKPINAILNKSRSAAGSGYQNDDYGYYPYPSENR